MDDASSESTGFWGQLSARSKLIIIIDLAVLVVVAAIATVYLVKAQRVSRASSVATPLTTIAPASTPRPAFKTSHGLAWIVAACGGPMILDDLPESPLPRAQDSAVCLVPETGASVLIGVYDDQSALGVDVAEVRGAHRYATHTDDDGNTWMFLVEGQNAAPLEPLERYGFDVQ